MVGSSVLVDTVSKGAGESVGAGSLVGESGGRADGSSFDPPGEDEGELGTFGRLIGR